QVIGEARLPNDGHAGTGSQKVMSRAAAEGVVAAPSHQAVVAAAAVQDVVPAVGNQRVLARSAGERVVAVAAEQQVVATLGAQNARNLDASAVDGVVAVAAVGNDLGDVLVGLCNDRAIRLGVGDDHGLALLRI